MLALLLPLSAARAQVATGTPPFGSFSGGPDIVNNANLNVHVNVPVMSKAGRGMPFTYALTSDSSVWYPVGVSGSQTWTPVANWGWNGVTQAATGYTYYTKALNSCPTGSYPNFTWHYWNYYSNFVYYDSFAIPHSMPVAVSNWDSSSGCGGGPPATMQGTATDGSGYNITASANSTTASATLYSASGATINAPLLVTTGQGSVLDASLNRVYTNSAGTTFTDTLGMIALTVSAPTPPASATYTYTGPNGSAVVTMKYTSFNIKTNFGCSGIGEVSLSNIPLVTEIDLPDSTKYIFAYEPTYNNSGYYTGRIASVQLPAGGTIFYSYGASGVNGITCADGSAATLTRTTPDGAWTYSRSAGPPAATTLSDPQGNQTTYNFQGIYETERKAYQGSTSGTLLATVDTCYNGASVPCTGTAISLPISNRTVQTTIPTLSAAKSYTTYNTYGLPTEVDEYDFGGTTPLRKTIVSYDYNTSCGVTNTYVVNRPCTIQVKDGGNTLKAETDNTYDANGNLLTESHVNTGGSPASVGRSFTYSSTGVLQTAKDFNGNQTTYTNNGCSSSFPTTITLPTPFSFTRTLTYDAGCNGAVLSSVTDENSRLASVHYTDSNNYWRPTEVDYPDGGKTTATYTDSINDFIVATSRLVSTGVNHQGTQTLDGLGRVIHSQDSSTGNKLDTTYDSTGRVHSVSNPYLQTTDPTYGLTTYAYDALGRVTGITYPDNNTANVSYSGGCATSTDAQSKARKVCADGLGRTTSVNEDPSGLNYSTTYTYNILDNLTGVMQGSQARTYVYDMLSRLTSASTPESGTTNFTYDANGNVKTRQDARGVTTTYAYDALNRLSSKAYSPNMSIVSANYFYDETSTSFSGATTLLNTKGRLSHTTTIDNGGATASVTVHSYDALGRTQGFWQCWYGACAPEMTYAYDLAGDLTQRNEIQVTTNYTVNQAQQVTQVTTPTVLSNLPATLATLTYTPFGAINTLTDGCLPAGTCTPEIESYAYNKRLQPAMIQLGNTGTGQSAANSCLVYNYYTVASNPTSCALPSYPPPTGAQNNGDVMGSYYVDTSNPSQGHTATYTYDALNRLATAVALPLAPHGAAYNLTYQTTGGAGYDRYGNVQCVQGLSQTQGYCPAATYNASNQLTGVGSTTLGYDGAGELASDWVFSYLYDGEGRLAWQIVIAGNYTYGGYYYNALGERVQHYNGRAGQTQVIYNDPWGRESQVMYGSTAQEIYLPPVAGRQYAMYMSGSTSFTHANALGSTGMLTDQTGAPKQEMLYYPFGWPWSGTSSDVRFAGMKPWDPQGQENNYFLTPNRPYDGLWGRWLSPDPLAGDVSNPQSLNRYAYVLNNPTNFTDPLGLYILNPNYPPASSPPGSGYLCAWFGVGCGYSGSNTSSDLSPLGTGSGTQTSPPPDVSNTWSKTFPCSQNATQLMSNVQGDFGQFADNPVGPFVAKFPDQPLQKGGTYDINSGVFLTTNRADAGPAYVSDLKVTVTAQTPNAWVFTTDPAHHYFNGTIAFIASNAGNGNVTFSVTASANFSNWVNKHILAPVIRTGEDSTWKNLLSNLQSYCSL